jgi:hypothetical protein
MLRRLRKPGNLRGLRAPKEDEEGPKRVTKGILAGETTQ